MLVDALRQHKVEGQVNRTVEKVRGLEIKQEVAEVAKEVVEVAKKVIRVVKEVVEDYGGKGGAIVYTHWINKMESVQDMSGCGNRGQEAAFCMTWEEFKVIIREEFCPNNEIQKLEAKFWCHAMVGDGHATYTDRFHELASAILKAGVLTDEEIRNGALKKTTKKRENSRKPSRDGNARDENKRSRISRALDYRMRPRIVNPLNARKPTAARGACFECDGTNHYKEVCPRLNQAQRPGGNHPNQVIAIEGG
ncbi:hypothetical protein Tco_1445198 [Tanacetum coccineum]